MGLRKKPFVAGEYYHLYNRGIDKKIIFIDKQDYEHFQYLLFVCNSIRSIKLKDIGNNFDRKETIVIIGAYCLMPNHFHIFLRAKNETGISKYMSKLLTAYAMYFNKKYNRSGKLFANTFKSSHVGNESYLKYIYAYIHLNPAKLRDKNWKKILIKSKDDLIKFVFQYPYSSLQEYLGFLPKQHYRIIDVIDFPDYFMKPLDHKNDLFDWLQYTTQDDPRG